MFDEHITRPWHFFIPVILVIIAGFFTQFPSWAWVGYFIALIAAAITGWLIYEGRERAKLNKLKEQNYLYAEVEKMDAEARYALGLAPAKNITKVIVDKAPITGGYFSQSYLYAPIAPYKLKILARGVLDGKPFHIREWTPQKEGKLLSDTEWRKLVAFLKQPDKNTPEIRFVIQRHETNERKGYDWTDQGKAWLEDIVSAPVAQAPIEK
jgi:hypothetical protein